MGKHSLRRVLPLLLVLCAAGSTRADTPYSYARILSLSYVSGDVRVDRARQPDLRRVLNGQPLGHQDKIETRDGIAEIALEDGTYVRLADHSRLDLAEMSLSEGGHRVSRLALNRGTATFVVDLRKHDVFTVSAPTFDVTVPDHATFRIDLADRHRVRVFDGLVEVETDAGPRRVAKNQMLEYDPQAREYRLARNLPRDDWDNWNRERDNIVRAGLSYGGSSLAARSWGYYHPFSSYPYCSSLYYSPYYNPYYAPVYASWGAWGPTAFYDPFFGWSSWYGWPSSYGYGGCNSFFYPLYFRRVAGGGGVVTPPDDPDSGGSGGGTGGGGIVRPPVRLRDPGEEDGRTRGRGVRPPVRPVGDEVGVGSFRRTPPNRDAGSDRRQQPRERPPVVIRPERQREQSRPPAQRPPQVNRPASPAARPPSAPPRSAPRSAPPAARSRPRG